MAAVGIQQVSLPVSRETTSSESSDNGANVVCKIKPLTPPSSGSPPRSRSPRSPRSPRNFKKDLFDENANRTGVNTSSDESGTEENVGTDADQKSPKRSPKLANPGGSGPEAESASDSDEDNEGGELVIDDDRLKGESDGSESNDENEDTGTPKGRAKGARAEVKVTTPRVPALTIEDTEDVPPGWHRRICQRMTGKTSGKFDVYIMSPDGKRFRSRPELMVHIKDNNLDYTIDDFSFKYKASPGAKSAAVVKTPKSAPPKRKKTPMKRPLLEKTEQAKVKRKKASPKKRSTSATRGPRKVLQPADSKKDKASRSQAFQKLLVRMNFKKPGERQETSSESDQESEDDFDDGLV